MSRRVPFVVLICLGFCVAPVALGQQTDASDLDRRLAELEKQLGQMLKEVKELRKAVQIVPQEAAAPRAEIKIFTLRHANATDMTRILQDLFQGREGKTMSIGADPRTNSVVIRGRSDLMEVIEAVVTRLDQAQPRPRTASRSRSRRGRRKMVAWPSRTESPRRSPNWHCDKIGPPGPSGWSS